MVTFKHLFVYTHTEKRRGAGFDALTDNEKRHARTEGRALYERLLEGQLSISCIISSPSARTNQTAELIRQGIHALYTSSVTIDPDLRESIEFNSLVAYRIRRCIENALQNDGDVAILITHPGVIHCIQKLFGVIPWRDRFSPVEQGSCIHIKIPIASCFEERSEDVTDWRCETPVAHLDHIGMVKHEKALVTRKWSEPEKVFRSTAAWQVLVDTWKQEKDIDRFHDDSRVYLAIAKFDCASLRDLTNEHLLFLLELEAMFPDAEYLKYVQYPPFVWKLHIHIIEIKNASRPPIHLLKYYSTVLFSDIIECLRRDKLGYTSRNLLVYSPKFN